MRHRKLQFSFLAAAALTASAALSACSADPSPSRRTAEAQGTAALALQVAPGVTLNSVSYTSIGPASFSKTGSFDLSQSCELSAVIGPLPAGVG